MPPLASGVSLSLLCAISLLQPCSAEADVAPCASKFVCVGVQTFAPPSTAAGATPADSTDHEPDCSWNGVQHPCSVLDLGWFNGNDGCYWQPASPQPPAGDPLWQGHSPDDGAVYSRTCLDAAGGITAAPDHWSKDPPQGYGGGVDLVGLAHQAVDKMLLADPAITTAPNSGSTGLIGMPVWMWATVSPTTWGPNTATADAGGDSVTATAHVTSMAWTMGDGHTVTCSSAGTPYNASYGGHASPDCGYTYTNTSANQPHAQFHITATAAWTVDWTGGGRQGQFALTRTSGADVAIAEAQAVVEP
ncbi:hypothetical protein P3T36_007266 [Kitasatospora sp. MAP12-15]|nr:hypothetical protein [Kitasatospora sp. MAP12-44]